MPADYALVLKTPLQCTLDQQGFSTGRAVFTGGYEDIIDNRYPTLKIGLPYIGICSGLSDPDGLVITAIDYRDAELTHNGIRLSDITVTASNRAPAASAGSFDFSVDIHSAVMQQRYRGSSFWQTAGLALPADNKIMNIPYSVLTLRGLYTLPFNAAAINSSLNTVNMYTWDLSALYGCSLGTIAPGCAKFVGYSYSRSRRDTAASPAADASFTFHLRSFDWNYKIRPAEITRDIDGHELYWQDRFSSLPTYIGNAVPGITPPAGTPVWSGTNTVLGGSAVLGQNAFDTELLPAADGTLKKEHQPAVWEFVGCTLLQE